ncbi:hypothetical protein [Flagellimonas sediminis]|uniref:Uncharacterized protein n=1 Tax=Flagellimonas sediminis TaxID=2696468 RepID=A0A6I5L0S2_9FLAO|nr:hypothetical protein [Allomuricauda sediminis]NDV43351.1 hypothetical protein [Allomuricauda sediminis]
MGTGFVIKFFLGKLGSNHLPPFFVAREEKGQTALLAGWAFVLYRGSWKPKVESRRCTGGRRSPERSGLEAEVFQLPQGLGADPPIILLTDPVGAGPLYHAI